MPAKVRLTFGGGSTLIFDREGGSPTLRYAITHPINDGAQLATIQAYKQGRIEQGLSLRETYVGDSAGLGAREPFCMLHSDQ